LRNTVQHQTNRSPARTRIARSRWRMLYVVAVGTLISTLNQAYKSSEVHVSVRMISGGRLLALTSSGYVSVHSTCDAHPRCAAREAPSRRKPLARSRAQYRRGNAPCPSSVRLREYLHKIYYPAAAERPFRKLLCKHSNVRETIGSRAIFISQFSHRVDPLYSYSWESTSRKAPDERTTVRTNKRMKKEKGERESSSERALKRYGFASLFEESRARNSSPMCSPRRLAGNYQWHPAGNSANDCRHTSPFDR